MIRKCHACGEILSDYHKKCSKCGASQHAPQIVRKAGRALKRIVIPRTDSEKKHKKKNRPHNR